MAKPKAIVPVERIEKAILFIRGEKVLLDRDLAELYGVETRVLNQAVGRNIKRFPKDFMFELTRDEIMRISQTVTSPQIKYSKRVHAFTEQGVAMLSSVLRSDRAIEVNIAIMRAFVKLRQMISSNKKLRLKIEEMEKTYATRVPEDVRSSYDYLKEELNKLIEEKRADHGISAG